MLTESTVTVVFRAYFCYIAQAGTNFVLTKEKRSPNFRIFQKMKTFQISQKNAVENLKSLKIFLEKKQINGNMNIYIQSFYCE